MQKFKSVLANTTLILGSLTVFFLLVEVLYVTMLAPHVPLKLQRHLSLKELSQPSKAHIVPEDYVMVTGDSYAAGSGDWLFTVDSMKNPDFNSVHVLHHMTGRDYMNVAHPGSGSIDSMIVEPVKIFESLNASPFVTLEPPSEILVYFYEGNDLENNTIDLFQDGYADIDPASRGEADTFENVLLPDALAAARKHFNRILFPLKTTFTVFDAILRTLRHEIKLLTGSTTEPFVNIAVANRTGAKHPWLGARGVNRILLVDSEAGAPPLFGPALSLTQDELRLGSRIFGRSLSFLKKYFPKAALTVVYIPSAASIYQFASDRVEVRLQTPDRRLENLDVSGLRDRSDTVCGLIASEAKALGAAFLDTRSSLRRAAAQEILHGPADPGHFNQRGYEILAHAIAHGSKGGGCEGT